MGIEENKALVRRHFEELLNGWNLDLVDEIFSPDYVHHHPDRDNLKPGIDGVKQFLAQAAAAFPDSRIVIEDICAEGDKVWVRTSSESTHLGDYLGLHRHGQEATQALHGHLPHPATASSSSTGTSWTTWAYGSSSASRNPERSPAGSLSLKISAVEAPLVASARPPPAPRSLLPTGILAQFPFRCRGSSSGCDHGQQEARAALPQG